MLKASHSTFSREGRKGKRQLPRWFPTETVARRANFLLTGRRDDQEIIYIKRTAILGKTHVEQSFFNKRKLTGLFAAHDTPACLRHSHTASRAGIATHRVTLSTATPKRPAAESPVSRGLRISAQPKSKGRQPAYTHRRLFFHPATKLLKRRVLPSHRNVTMSARKASFTCFSIAELRLCCTKTVIF